VVTAHTKGAHARTNHAKVARVDVLYFVLLVSALIFVHEFGHFVVAKAFGVKVLTFSIGLGPRLLRLRGKETEYCLALLPFGGFIKMLEESKQSEPLLPEERARSFEAQAMYKRVLIVIAGPLMNLVFPVLLYMTVFLEDRQFAAPLVGAVEPGHAADGKLMPGDVIVAIDQINITSFPEVTAIVSGKAGTPLKFLVDRDGKKVELWVTPTEETETVEPRELGIVNRVGRVGISPRHASAVLGVRSDSRAYKAGLRTFDHVVAINGRRTERYTDLINILSQNRGESVRVEYLRPTPVSVLGNLSQIAVYDAGEIDLTPAPRDPEFKGEDFLQREHDVLARVGLESSEMYVAFVPAGSSEWQAGLRAGDRMVSVDNVEEQRWGVFVKRLLAHPTETHLLRWIRLGQTLSGEFRMRRESWVDDLGQRQNTYVFRTTHWLPDAPGKTVPNPHPYWYAISRGVRQTITVTEFILVGFVRLAQGRVSLSSVGGLITVYDIAGQAAAKGTSDFLWAMAIISVNLGLVNLLPIPVLDGGQLLFLLIEGIGRRALSVRVRERASLFGIAIMVLLMMLAFKNDLSRRSWDGLRDGVRTLFR
jgi:regulator of sigma E protease